MITRTSTEHLVLDVLAGRYRSGERAWTFPRHRSIVKALSVLEHAGLLWWKGGVVQGTVLAGLTEAGVAELISLTYQSPAEISANLARHDLLAVEDRVAGERAGGAGAIAAERQRQIIVEGYTAEHDRQTPVRTLVQAAGAYLGLARWPWAPQFFKFDDGDGYYRRRNLVKAGALIAAAIDRIDNVGEGR